MEVPVDDTARETPGQPRSRTLWVAVAVVAAAVCVGGFAARGAWGTAVRPNVLVVLIDDVGPESLAAYGATGPDVARTPTLDRLAAEGVTFDNAYADPSCSPTRYTLLTGRHARRVGLGMPLHATDPYEVPLAETTVAELLRDRGGYATSLAGKWHLSTYASPSSTRHPGLQGFDWHAGSLGNLRDPAPGRFPAAGYYRWTKIDNGRPVPVRGFSTTDTTDDAVGRIAEMPEPWFLYVAFNAVHRPFERPPPRSGIGPEVAPARALLESLDQELGRMLAALSPEVRARTWIFVLSDNGADVPIDVEAITYDGLSAVGKGTTTESGVHVPWIVAGPGVRAGTRSAALIHTVDLLPTVAELAGLDPAAVPPTSATRMDALADGTWTPPDGPVIDGVSFASSLVDPAAPGARRYVYVEQFMPLGPPPYDLDRHALRDDRYKLERVGEHERFYDLGADRAGVAPIDPSAAPDAHARLASVLAATVGALRYEGPSDLPEDL